MLERVHNAAERAAAGVSRRAWFGRLGRGALVVAGALAGLAASPGGARAGGHCCCGDRQGFPFCVRSTGKCGPDTFHCICSKVPYCPQ
jgi:hypothetical protein